MAAHVILCIFNQGCSAAAFIFRLNPVVNYTPPLPAFVSPGGF